MSGKKELIQSSIIRDMTEGVMIIGLDGKIQFFNPAATEILGKTSEEMIGKRFAVLFMDDERNDVFNQTVVDAILDSTLVHYNLVPYYISDSEKTLYVMTSFLWDGEKKIALIVMLNDMTDIRQMEKRHANQVTALIDSLVKALSVAIEERSHYSACHTENMVRMAEAFLSYLDKTDDPWKFSESKKHAFIMSVWLHDVGKLSIPLSVMDKATRLGGNLDLIQKRFRDIHLLDRIAFLEGKITEEEYNTLEEEHLDWLAFIKKVNNSGFLSDEDAEKVKFLSEQIYTEEDGTKMPILTDEEITCLMIKKGTLTAGERETMQNHVVVTRKILEKVEFPEEYAMVTEWASSHHEQLSGKGYPDHRSGDDIPREVCLLTILDIFEALTAKDRPYKKPVPPERSLGILHSMVNEGSLDGDVLDLFEKSGCWKIIH